MENEERLGRFLTAKVNRRLFLRLGVTAGVSWLLGCENPYIQEQKSPDGRISTLTLPGGENHPETGKFSLFLPAESLVRQAYLEDGFAKGRYIVSVRFALDQRDRSTLTVQGRIGHNGEEYISGVIISNARPQLQHRYSTTWENWVITSMQWDDTVLAPTKRKPI